MQPSERALFPLIFALIYVAHKCNESISYETQRYGISFENEHGTGTFGQCVRQMIIIAHLTRCNTLAYVEWRNVYWIQVTWWLHLHATSEHFPFDRWCVLTHASLCNIIAVIDFEIISRPPFHSLAHVSENDDETSPSNERRNDRLIAWRYTCFCCLLMSKIHTQCRPTRIPKKRSSAQRSIWIDVSFARVHNGTKASMLSQGIVWWQPISFGEHRPNQILFIVLIELTQEGRIAPCQWWHIFFIHTNTRTTRTRYTLPSL